MKTLKKSLPVFILIFFFFFSTGRISGFTDPDTYIRKLWIDYQKAKNDSIRIGKLARLAFFYSDYLDNQKMADKISEMAIDLAQRSYRPELLLLAYNDYIESNDLDANQEKAMQYALKACQLSGASNNSGMEWRSCINLVNVYLSSYQFDKALEYADKSLAIASTMDDNTMIAESYLAIGRSYEGKNRKIEAFRSYLNAVYLAEKMNTIPLIIKCYSQLSDFYKFNKMVDKAIYYKLKQGDLIKSVSPVDSMALMWTFYYLQGIEMSSSNNELNEKNMESILNFAIRNKAERMKNYEFALYRTHLIQADQIDQLYDFYYRKYPLEFKRFSTENPALYCRMQALFKEKENEPDSAFFYFNKAEKLIRSEPNKILQSRFYNRFGSFLVRHGHGKDAIDKFVKSYDLAQQASYFDFMLDASRQLETLYAGLGDFKNAYVYASRNRILTDSINNLSKKEEVIMLEINHEARQRELFAEMQKQKILRRHNIQYTAIPVIIVVVFIFLMMLGSFRVPEWSLRVMGFFSFIFLFEFIVLITDHKILEITHGEPWKILLIKIGLIAILLPLHEWLEKLVIEYLLKHKLIDFNRFSPVNYIKRKTGKKRVKSEESSDG
jgi:tetratricopeptide (TPR) repeat protein